MRKIIVFIFLLFSICSVSASEKVAVADLSMLVSLHPQMALFDFERLGFYRLPLGLSEEEWKKRLVAAKRISPKRYKQLKEAKATAEKKLQDINEKIRKIVNFPLGNGIEFQTKTEKLKKLANQENQIRTTVKECDYQIACPELTSLKETRKILNNIEKEVIQTVKSVCKKKGYSLVLNASIPVPYGFPVKYETSEMFGVGLPGIDTHLLYSFISNVDHVLPSDKTPASIKMIHWLELTNYPECQNYLPIRPYPLVLSGGTHVEKEVIREIYNKYHIDKKVIKAACEVIDSINEHRANFQTEIPVFNKAK